MCVVESVWERALLNRFINYCENDVMFVLVNYGCSMIVTVYGSFKTHVFLDSERLV